VPNPKIDCIIQSEFDHANRKIAETDPLGNTDKFQKDALGNTVVHTDRANNDWLYHYDAAERLDTETTPPVDIVNVEEKLVNNKMVLIPTQTTLAIQNTKFMINQAMKFK